MNARIIKETRTVLPVFCVTVLACAAPRLIWSPETAGGVGLTIFTICCLILGAGCFGNEYQWRTMPLLLAQPVPRRKIWNEKMLVLGTTLGLGLLVFLLCVPLEDPDARLFVILVPFGVLCTAPWMALKIKNTVMAAVCTCGLPFGLSGTLALMTWVVGRYFPAAGKLVDDLVQNHPYSWAGATAAIYCAVCYRLGYRTFLKLEAVDLQARELALPPRMEALLARPMARFLPGYRGPWTSLIRKELQLQKPAFLMAGVLCIASPLAALVWHLNQSDLFVGLASTAIAVLVFAVPFIVAGMCVAEERNWGVSGWQLALPVSARKQWVAKMMAVVFTSVLLGVVVPLLMWISDGWVFHLPIGPEPLHFDRLLPLPTPQQMLLALPVVLDFVLGYMLVLGLGVFASSTCANSAKAMIMNLSLLIASGGIAAGIISAFATPLVMYYRSVSTPMWEHYQYLRIPKLPNGQPAYQGEPVPSPLGFATDHAQAVLIVLGVLLALLLVLVQCLAHANHRNGEPSSRRVWRQLAVVTGSIAAGAVFYWALLYWNMVGALFSSR